MDCISADSGNIKDVGVSRVRAAFDLALGVTLSLLQITRGRNIGIIAFPTSGPIIVHMYSQHGEGGSLSTGRSIGLEASRLSDVLRRLSVVGAAVERSGYSTAD
jgi:hypothetical protein